MCRLLLILLCCFIGLHTKAQADLPRHPSIDEVAAYLRTNLGEPPANFTSYFWPDEANALRYLDVNGDGEEDLIAEGWLFVAVLLWQNERYSLPFQHIVPASTDSGAWSRVSFADYTRDEHPEIIFDLRLPHENQQNSGANHWRRSLIHCEEECRLIWQEETASYFWLNGSEAGIYLYQSAMQSIESNGELWLELTRRDFAFNCRVSACRVSQESQSPDLYEPRSRVGAVIKQRFRWDGLRFNREESLVLVDSHPLIFPAQLEANHENKTARLETGASCQLLLNEQALGETFSCLPDFSRLEWRDLTGDAIPEILLIYAWFDSQTLLIYSQEGRELGRITGAIRESDGFGIRLLEDGILSAGQRYSVLCSDCWFELNQQSQLYRWNGAGFELV